MSNAEKIYYIDRKTGKTLEEKVYCEPALRFLYGTQLGRFVCTFLARLPLASHITGWWQRQRWTQKNILPFISQYGIDAAESAQPIASFRSFDAFFTRKLKKEARPLAQGAIIPADGRYIFYQNIDECDGFVVKGKKFCLKKLVGSFDLAEKYAAGSMAIARLCPSDYHRFHFPIDCIPGPARLINGPLYSVNPIAVRQNVELLTENKRMITELKTDNYGSILYIEIGATTVGTVHQTYQPGVPYRKGDEKGYFSFGGSSIILLFEKGKVQFASDLLNNSSQHVETLCLMGQPLERPLS